MKIFGVVNLNQSTSNEESGCGLLSCAQEYLGYLVLLHKNCDQNEGHETSIAKQHFQALVTKDEE